MARNVEQRIGFARLGLPGKAVGTDDRIRVYQEIWHQSTLAGNEGRLIEIQAISKDGTPSVVASPVDLNAMSTLEGDEQITFVRNLYTRIEGKPAIVVYDGTDKIMADIKDIFSPFPESDTRVTKADLKNTRRL